MRAASLLRIGSFARLGKIRMPGGSSAESGIFSGWNQLISACKINDLQALNQQISPGQLNGFQGQNQ